MKDFETMDFARAKPQRAHYHADILYKLFYYNRIELMAFRGRQKPTWFASNIPYTPINSPHLPWGSRWLPGP